MRYDLIIIGNSPSGHHGALTAAKLHQRVALIDDRPEAVDGSDHHQLISPKGLREAILLLTGFRHRTVSPELFERRQQITPTQLHLLSDQFVQQEAESADEQLKFHGVESIAGTAHFVSPHEVEVLQGSRGTRRLSGDRLLIAVSSKPTRPSWIPFDGQTIVDTDELRTLNRIPRSMIVVGGGVHGLEHAMMFAVLGTHVGVVDLKTRLLDFCDQEMTSQLIQSAQSLGIEFHLGRPVIEIERIKADQAAVRLEGGERLLADTVLYAAGQSGNTDSLNLSAAGLMPDEQGRLWCNEHYQTWVKHIYGVGDIVGFPALASLAMEQGRHAVQHAFGENITAAKQIPYGLFTIPEFAMIGPTEERLRQDDIRYEVGRAILSETSRGHISGSSDGLLKLLFARDSLQLLAVHCLGESATELIHIGQTVMSLDGSIDHFRDKVFHDPTLAECYRTAAKDVFKQRDEKRSVRVSPNRPRQPSRAHEALSVSAN